MGFVYRVLKALWIVKLSETINIWKFCNNNKNKLGCPRELYHRFMYIVLSSDHQLLILNVPFKMILKKIEVVFWCLEWELCKFRKTDENSFKSTNTTALKLGISQLSEHVIVHCNSEKLRMGLYLQTKGPSLWGWMRSPNKDKGMPLRDASQCKLLKLTSLW